MAALSGLLASGLVDAEDSTTRILMPRGEDFTSMWWAEGFPGVVKEAPWVRCIQTGNYAMAMNTETMQITHLGPVSTGADYVSFGTDHEATWGKPSPSDLRLSISANGKTFRCTEGGKWSRFTGPRLVEAGRYFQRADITDLTFTSDDGEKLNAEARFETAAWSDRLGFILAARPGESAITPGPSSFGKVGGGFGLDGKNSFDIPHSPAIDSEVFTLEFWAFVPANHTTSKHGSPWLVCKNRNEGSDGNFGITIQRGIPQARINIGGGSDGHFKVIPDARHKLRLNAWNHLAMSYDGDSLHLHVNGKLAGSTKIGRKRKPGKHPLVFGRREDNHGDGYHFLGVIDEIRMHDRALKPQELAQSYHHPGASRPNVGEWTFQADGQALPAPPRETWAKASMEIELSTAKGALSLKDRIQIPQNGTNSPEKWQQVSLSFNPTNFEAEKPTSPVSVVASQLPGGNARPVEYDTSIGWHRVNLDGITPTPPPGVKGPSNDAVERVRLVLINPTAREEMARMMFEKDRGGFQQRIGSSITGISAMLRDTSGNPIGVPVQLSKNWHNEPEGGVYAGLWFHGITQLRLPPRSTSELELTICYGNWGGVPAASHAQLSLIGWGSNQLWHQSALGSWGESICYEPEQGQANCTITDVRPAMVRGDEKSPKWKWTGNMGGGDFFRFYDPTGERVPHSAMKTTNLRQGPCLTEINYAGRIGKGITHSSTVSLARTDDIVRGTYKVRLDVQKPSDFSRFVVFQIGADTYNFTRERKMALGNENGLIREWNTQWGDGKDRGKPMSCTGNTPWISLHERDASIEKKHDEGANRGIVIRSWKARLGGKETPPWIVERGLHRGRTDSSNINIVPPPGVTRLEPGDYVEAVFEHIVMPVSAAEYYGPNESLRSALTTGANTWKMIFREAKGNTLKTAMKTGDLERSHPDLRIATEGNQADFTLSGGIGFIPVTFTNLSSSSVGSLLIDGKALDQSVHGHDFWQTDFDTKTQTWSRTYNIPANEKASQLIQFKSK
ncbi:LamG domain-containing protein [Haloferula sp.]|uniref:LamG domain-containing protein n=1 Tax=Haloferula sp. TaxID=2497595 RepID=UPI00329E735C